MIFLKSKSYRFTSCSIAVLMFSAQWLPGIRHMPITINCRRKTESIVHATRPIKSSICLFVQISDIRQTFSEATNSSPISAYIFSSTTGMYVETNVCWQGNLSLKQALKAGFANCSNEVFEEIKNWTTCKRSSDISFFCSCAMHYSLSKIR